MISSHVGPFLQFQLHWTTRLIATIIALSFLRVAAADEYQHSFMKKQFDVHTLRVLGSTQHIHRENEGLRFSIAKKKSEPDKAGISYPLQMLGDCAIEVKAKLLDFPVPERGYGTGLVVLIEDGVQRGASLQLVRTNAGDTTFVAHHYTIDKEGQYRHVANAFPADLGKIYKLRLRRVGSELLCEVAEESSQEFRVLSRIPFCTNALQNIQVYAQTGGEPNTVNVRVIELKVEAEQMRRTGAGDTPSRLGWIVTTCLLVATPLVLSGVAWKLRRGH